MITILSALVSLLSFRVRSRTGKKLSSHSKAIRHLCRDDRDDHDDDRSAASLGLDVLGWSGPRAEPARVLECDGCGRNCFMPVHVRPAEGNQLARAFISCDKPEDVGRVPVALEKLEQRRDYR